MHSFTELDILILAYVAFGAFFGSVITKFGVKKYTHSKMRLDSKTSILFSLYTAGNHVLQANSGELKKISYRSYFTLQDAAISEAQVMDPGAVLFVLELDFNTQAHIVGLGKDAPFDRMKIKSHIVPYHIEELSLEGDFPNYFNVYAPRDQQMLSRYVFDPEAMAAFVDYLQHNFWELVGDELYIIIAKDHAKVGPILAKAEELVNQIRPALIRTLPGQEPVNHEPSYGSFGKKQLPCPICAKKMHIDGNVQGCPSGHGILLHGGTLVKFRRGEQDIVYSGKSQPHGDLKCPKCKGTMQLSRYSLGDFEIDVCMKCAYRWIDADEIQKIKKN